MATGSSRLAVFGENVDQEKDSNSLLLELDKGLRSGKVGEQCEAIVRFPHLFEKYPFPILINSSFLKVADVFRVGNNILRLCVLRVTQQSEKHLEKITSIDEFLRRIYAVIHSNDPVARALTLRTLGSVACIIAERKNVHHSIISSLDSHDEVELDAAIFAAYLFAAKSKSFSSSICGKLAEMIESMSVPLDMKLKLISIFEHMHFDPENYQRVRQLCTKMLADYPSCKFVLPVLRTLTHLATCSLVDIPGQVALLLHYFHDDVRVAVRLAALKDLRQLARRAPHMWTSSDIESLIDAVKPNLDDDLLLGVITVLSTLSQTVVLASLPAETRTRLLDCCLSCCYHDNVSVVATAMEMLVGIVAEKLADGQIKMSDMQLMENACLALQMAVTVGVNGGTSQECQKILASVVRVCKLHTTAVDQFVDAITSCLSLVIAGLGGQPGANDLPVKRAVLLCNSLSAISDVHSGVLQGVVPEFIAMLRTVLTKRFLCDETSEMKLALSRLILQACTDDDLTPNAVNVIRDVRFAADDWMAYKIARQAARYGHHSLAADIFAKLTVSVSTEQFYFWLNAVKECCAGESHLHQSSPSTLSEFVSQMLQAEARYHAAVVALKAAATPNHPLNFQIEYAQLRACLLPAFARVVQACCSFQTSPPPAIAASLAVTTGLEKHRCEHVIVQLRKCSQAFTDVDGKYTSLVQSSFDADVSTLSNIDRLQQICRLMVHVIDSVLSLTDSESSKTSPVTLTPPSIVEPGTSSSSSSSGVAVQSAWSITANHVLELLNNVNKLPATTPLTDQHMTCIQQVSVLLARVRHCLPRYFFQRLQTTVIKLAISPHTSEEPVLVQYDTRLTLKVEGVVQVGTTQQTKCFHNVHSVELLVKSKQSTRAQTLDPDAKPQENPSNEMVQTVVPHNDYFSVQFLLAFPVTGVHQVTVEAAVVDAGGKRWNTGPRSTFNVKSYDEAWNRHQQIQYANQPRHVHPVPPPPTRSAQATRTPSNT